MQACDPKRPWPACPPQSYCYAAGAVDIGPYYCCASEGSAGAGYRPEAPFYSFDPLTGAGSQPSAPVRPEVYTNLPANNQVFIQQMKRQTELAEWLKGASFFSLHSQFSQCSTSATYPHASDSAAAGVPDQLSSAAAGRS